MPFDASLVVIVTAAPVALVACTYSYYFQADSVFAQDACGVSLGLMAIASSIFIPPLFVDMMPAPILAVAQIGIGRFTLGASLHANFVGAVTHVVSDRVIEPIAYRFSGGENAVLASYPVVGNVTAREAYRPLVRGGVSGFSSLLTNPGNGGDAVDAAFRSASKYFFKTNGDLFGDWQASQAHRILGGAFYPIAKGAVQGHLSCELAWSATMKACKEIYVAKFPLPSERKYNSATFVMVDWITYVGGEAVENAGAAICPMLGELRAIGYAGMILSVFISNDTALVEVS